MRKVNKEIWTGYIKGICVEIVKWQLEGQEKPTWNSYIIIFKDNVGDDFKKLLCNSKKYRNRYSYDYWKLGYFNMHCGLSYYEKIRNEIGKIVAVKVGCDYNHLWDEGNPVYYEKVLGDLKESVDYFIDIFPKYKVWCSGNGKYYYPKDGIFGEDGYFRSNEYSLEQK